MPIPIPAPMAPMATPIQTTSDLVTPPMGPLIWAVAGRLAVRARAHTMAVARISFRPACIANLKSIQVHCCWLTTAGRTLVLRCTVLRHRCGDSEWLNARWIQIALTKLGRIGDEPKKWGVELLLLHIDDLQANSDRSSISPAGFPRPR